MNPRYAAVIVLEQNTRNTRDPNQALGQLPLLGGVEWFCQIDVTHRPHCRHRKRFLLVFGEPLCLMVPLEKALAGLFRVQRNAEWRSCDREVRLAPFFSTSAKASLMACSMPPGNFSSNERVGSWP